MKKHLQIVVYGVSLGTLALVLKIVEFRFALFDYALEAYLGVVALLFLVVGVWFGIQLRGRRSGIAGGASRERPFSVDQELLRELEVSKREYEVLELIAQGFSTKEIADKLFVSANTVKTHSASLFQKLNARRRTQAVQKAKSLGLLP